MSGIAAPLLALLALVIHVVLVLAAAPVIAGLIPFLQARFSGLSGPPLLQPWRDLLRLARKVPVLPESASELFAAAPAFVLAATGAAALLVPSFATGMLTAPGSDLLVIGGLLMAARAALVLAALDAGTAPGGMAAGREIGLAALAEPALLLVILVVAGTGGTTNLDIAAATLRDAPLAPHVPLALAMPALTLVALALNAGRGSGPAGEAALTAEFSGRHLAALEFSRALRLVIWFNLIGALACPFGMAPLEGGLVAWVAGLVLWGVKMLVLAVALALVEAMLGPAIRARLPGLLGFALLLGLLAAAFLFAGTGSV